MFKFLYLFGLLLKLDIYLSINGFSKTFSKYSVKYYKKDSELFNEETAKEVLEFFNLLDVVCTWYPRKADCIHKTLIGYKILRRKYSLPVDMVVGVRKFPFEAHAWLKMHNNDLFEEVVVTDSLKVVLESKKIIRNG